MVLPEPAALEATALRRGIRICELHPENQSENQTSGNVVKKIINMLETNSTSASTVKLSSAGLDDVYVPK